MLEYLLPVGAGLLGALVIGCGYVVVLLARKGRVLEERLDYHTGHARFMAGEAEKYARQRAEDCRAIRDTWDLDDKQKAMFLSRYADTMRFMEARTMMAASTVAPEDCRAVSEPPGDASMGVYGGDR